MAPMRWSCEKSGCYNKRMRPKIEIFDDCFPNNIQMGDVDGIVEINGFGILLEWKSSPAELPLGQRIMYQRLTAKKILFVLCVAGNAETMEVTHVASWYDGKWEPWYPANMEDVRTRIKNWVKYVSIIRAPEFSLQ